MVALRLGVDALPGTTVHRYCASSLQATRMAMHAIRSGEGDAFVVAGVEMVSRFARRKADGMPGTRNGRYADAMSRTEAISADNRTWSDPREGPGWPPR